MRAGNKPPHIYTDMFSMNSSMALQMDRGVGGPVVFWLDLHNNPAPDSPKDGFVQVGDAFAYDGNDSKGP